MKLLLLGLLTLPLCASPVRGQAPAGDDAPPPPAKLSGTVTDMGGKPLGDVLITADRGKATYSAHSGADGSFTITCGEANSIYGNYLAANGDRSLIAYGQEEPAKGGLPPAPLHLVAKPARTIAVTVLDGRKASLAGATVASGAFSFQMVDRAVTDAHGAAPLHVPQDAPLEYVAAFKGGVGLDYQLVAQKDQPRTDPYHLAPDFSQPVTLTLNGAVSVKVHVADEAGQAMAGVDVDPWYFTKPNKGGELNCGLADFNRTTDGNGDATFDYLPADEQVGVAFWVRKEGYTSPQGWVWRPGSKGDVVATLVAQVPLAGIVRDQMGRPAGSATVSICGDGFQIGGFQTQVKTKADGTFATEVDPELYYLVVAYRGVEAARANFIMHKDPLGAPLELKLAPAQHVHGQVTAGPKKKPAPDTEVSIVIFDDSYNDLPPAVQFPGGVVNRKGIAPHFSMMTSTDKIGGYDFYAIPGDGYVECYIPPGRVMEQLKRSAKPEVTVNLHSDLDPDAPVTFTGKVVLASDPSKTVPLATIASAASPNTGLVGPNGTAGADGTFTLRRSTVVVALAAISPDRKLAGMITLRPGDDHVTIPLAAAASVTGRLIDQNNNPVSNIDLLCVIDIKEMISLTLDERLRPDVKGNFAFTGLLPGHDYEIQSQGPEVVDGMPATRFIRTIHVPSSASAEPISLGDIPLPQIAR